MDNAMLYVPGNVPYSVTAEDMAKKYQGRIPDAISFECPFCTRPVIICADDNLQEATIARALRGNQRRSNQRPHFRHTPNDEFAHLCPYYREGVASGPLDQPPFLPMFLRRCGNQDVFQLEIGVRRRGRDLAPRLRQEQATLTVDGIPHDLADLVERRKATIVINNPSFDLHKRIHVPDQWRLNIGVAQNGTNNVLLFTDEFGSNGGRRIAVGGTLKIGFDYYAVVRQAGVLSLQSSFDVAEQVGILPCDDEPLIVMRFRLQGESPKHDRAMLWALRRGFRIANFGVGAVPIWPPQLHSDGVDEPLFEEAKQIYISPFALDSAGMENRVTVYTPPDTPTGPSRKFGLAGFECRRKPDMEMESSCCFLRASRHLPWSAYMAAKGQPDGIQLADPPIKQAGAYGDRPDTPSFMDQREAVLRITSQSFNKHLSISQARTAGRSRQSLLTTPTIATIRTPEGNHHL